MKKTVRQQILDGLIADKGGEKQISSATSILAEVIASDAWLMIFNGQAYFSIEQSLLLNTAWNLLKGPDSHIDITDF